MSVKHKAVAVPYEPKPREKAAIEAWRERRRVRGPSPKVKVGRKRDTPTIEVDHPDPETGGTLLMDAIGTVSDGFAEPFLSQLANARGTGAIPDQSALTFMLSVVKGIEPRDEIEAMLAGQMAAVHMAIMTSAPPQPRREHSPTGQRRAVLQQARPHLCGSAAAP